MCYFMFPKLIGSFLWLFLLIRLMVPNQLASIFPFVWCLLSVSICQTADIVTINVSFRYCKCQGVVGVFGGSDQCIALQGFIIEFILIRTILASSYKKWSKKCSYCKQWLSKGSVKKIKKLAFDQKGGGGGVSEKINLLIFFLLFFL